MILDRANRRYRSVSKHDSPISWFMAAFIAALSYISGAGLASIGYALVYLSLHKMIFNQDRPFEIRWLIILVAVVQNVIAPHLTYLGAYEHFKYYMYLEQDQYMAFTVPATVAFAIGLLCFGSKKEAASQHHSAKRISQIINGAPQLPVFLLGLSFVGPVLVSVVPSLGFVGVLFSNLKYSAALLVLFSGRKDRFIWLSVILGIAALEALSTSMLHDVILWAVFVGGALTFQLRVKPSRKLIAASLLICAVIVAQSVKHDFRKQAWSGEVEGSSQLYFDLASERVEDLLSGEIAIDEMVGSTVMRLNQGWIVSRIMTIVPIHEPYAAGDTVVDAVQTSILPRLLFSDKPMAGGQENFRRFTQLEISDNTSMGIGLYGEAFANFGQWGGAVFLLIYGLVLTMLVKGALAFAVKYPVILAFLPNIVLHAVKSETELLVALNFLIKSALFHVVLAWAVVTLFGAFKRPRPPYKYRALTRDTIRRT